MGTERRQGQLVFPARRKSMLQGYRCVWNVPVSEQPNNSWLLESEFVDKVGLSSEV